MTHPTVDAEFERTMGCTSEELVSWLPIALPNSTIETRAYASTAEAAFADGTLRLAWRELPERRIALLVIPCLQVRFTYAGMTPARRHEVQRRFDLATQRGGG